jgi:AraC-like DNA-binding protein
MESTYTLIKVLAASQVLLFIGLLFFSKNPLHIRAIGITLMTAIVIFFFFPLIVLFHGERTAELISAIPSMIPMLTLMFVWAIFEEDCFIPKWIIALFCIDTVFSLWRALHGHSNEEAELIAQLIKVFAASYAIYIVWRGREHDLVEMRLKVRLIFVGALSISVLGVSLDELLEIYNVKLPGQLLGNLWMLSISFLGNAIIIKLNPELGFVGDPKELVVKQVPEDTAVVQLLERMQSERLYADHDLRVGSLAHLIGIPEYQLRQKINQSLGYRNFNQFVNRYRIEEAGVLLLENTRTPILTVALEVGFRSISSFNTAFQAQFGVSPTKYRNQSLSDS